MTYVMFVVGGMVKNNELSILDSREGFRLVRTGKGRRGAVGFRSGKRVVRIAGGGGLA